jgi:hypothetical protein
MTFLAMWFWRLLGYAMLVGIAFGLFFLAGAAGLVSLKDNKKGETDGKQSKNDLSKREALIAGLLTVLGCSVFGWYSFDNAGGKSALLAKYAQQDAESQKAQTSAPATDNAQPTAAAETQPSSQPKIPSAEQSLLTALVGFDLSKYEARLRSLGDVDDDGKRKLEADCQADIRNTVGSILPEGSSVTGWIAVVSLRKCTILDTPTSIAATCDDPKAVRLDFSDTKTSFEFSTAWIEPTDPVYPQILRLKNAATVQFSGDNIKYGDTFECSTTGFSGDRMKLGYFGGLPFDFHLQLVKSLPESD